MPQWEGSLLQLMAIPAGETEVRWFLKVPYACRQAWVMPPYHMAKAKTTCTLWGSSTCHSPSQDPRTEGSL